MKAYKNILLFFLTSALALTACLPKFQAGNYMDMISHGSLKKEALDFSDVEMWNQKRSEKDGEIFKDILEINNSSKAGASLEWLRDTIKSGETDYIYPVMYAFQIHRSQYLGQNPVAKQTAAIMKYYAALLLFTDAARCDDKGIGISRLTTMSNFLEPVNQEIKKLPIETKEKAMDIALFLEENNKGRDKRPDICKDGIGFTARALQSKNTTTEESIAKEGNLYGHIPGSKQVAITPDSDVEVFFVSDEEWHKKRNEIREKLLTSLNKEKN